MGIFQKLQKSSAKLAKDYISLEERSDGATEDEHELVFYAKLTDISALANLKYEDQEQWAYRFTSFNNLNVQNRVRRTIAGETTQYTHTVKTFKFSQEQVPVKSECCLEATSDLFELYKTISENGMRKRRFFLPFIVNQKEYTFEIDVFRNSDTEETFSEWVKIDLELDPEKVNATDWVKHLPECITDVIDSRNPTPEQKAQITDLYETVFLVKNTAQ